MIYNVERAIRRAAAIHGIPASEIMSPSRRRSTVVARDAAVMEARDAGYSLTEIGAVLRRDHTTIMLAERRARKRAGQ
jgi:chromosomal replication initiation ATPase DnaA